MNKTTIIIAITVIVVALIGGGVFLFLQHQPTAPVTSQNGVGTPSSGTTLSLGDALVPLSDISSGPPADAPQGATISFQTANGAVTLNNFYTGAQGYWAPLDAVLLTNNSAYAIWYYRDPSNFLIEVALNGTTADEDAAETVLATDLGVSQNELCSLPVAVTFATDRGTDSQQYPLDICPAAGVGAQ